MPLELNYTRYGGVVGGSMIVASILTAIYRPAWLAPLGYMPVTLLGVILFVGSIDGLMKNHGLASYAPSRLGRSVPTSNFSGYTGVISCLTGTGLVLGPIMLTRVFPQASAWHTVMWMSLFGSVLITGDIVNYFGTSASDGTKLLYGMTIFRRPDGSRRFSVL
jgi:hypothetical protein